MEQQVMLQVSGLTVSIKAKTGSVPIVRGVSFNLAKGEILGILGESGSGKTLSSTSIIGLHRDSEALTSAGSIMFKGRNLLQLGDNELNAIRGKEISYIFQDPVASLNPYRKVGKQIEEILRTHGLPVVKEQVLEIMQDVGLDNAGLIYNMYPFQLSGGQCQRVTIAIAVICRPDLLIADEPISAIDASLQKKVLKLLQDINTRLGTAIVIITHDFSVARYLCNKVVIMYGGLVMEQGSVKQVLDSPRHPYTIELLKCVDSLAGNSKSLYTLQGRAPHPVEAGPGCPFYERCKSRVGRCGELLPELLDCGGNHTVRCLQVAV